MVGERREITIIEKLSLTSDRPEREREGEREVIIAQKDQREKTRFKEAYKTQSVNDKIDSEELQQADSNLSAKIMEDNQIPAKINNMLRTQDAVF